MQNLEPMAARTAHAIAHAPGCSANDVENLTTKALDILSQQGFYAFALFLATRRRQQDQSVAKAIDTKIRALLVEAGMAAAEMQNRPIHEFYRHVVAIQPTESAGEALQRLLLAKSLAELALTYTRYATKARAAQER